MYDMYAGDDHASIVICMELCDRGSLWAAVCKGTFCGSSYSSCRFDVPPMTVGAWEHVTVGAWEHVYMVNAVHTLSLVMRTSRTFMILAIGIIL